MNGDLDADLAELRHHWGSAYSIHHPAPDVWLAQRRDDHDTLRACTPLELLGRIRQDYQDRPVPRGPASRGPEAPSCRFLPEG